MALCAEGSVVIVRLSRTQVSSWRLSKAYLTQRVDRKRMEAVVSGVCGIQAQLMSASELALWARIDGIREEDVRNALWKRHTIVRTWCMRGTLHLLAASELPVYAAALRTKLAASEKWLEKNRGVKPSELAAVTDEIDRILTDGMPTREELARRIESTVELTPEARECLRSAWGTILRPAAYRGALAFGPSRGPRVTFLRPRNWMAEWNEPSPRDAFRDLFRRFVSCYGPATLADFAHWWGGLESDQRALLDPAGGGLEEVEVEGHRGWMLKPDAEEAAGMEGVRVVKLLPSFDCYAMFFSPREMFVSRAHRARVFRKTAGWNYPSLIVDGFAAGIWSLRKAGGRIKVTVEPFHELGAREKVGLLEETAAMGAFFDLPADVRYSPVS